MGPTPAPPPSLNASAYLRTASVAIAAYDYVLTLPAEYRFYKAQKGWFRLNQQCLMFIYIRYISLVLMTIANVGFFHDGWSVFECRHYFMIAPVFKVLQTMASQLILATRTYSISKREPWVLWCMSVLYVLTTGVEFFVNLYMRTPVQNLAVNLFVQFASCASGNGVGHHIAWIHYIIAMSFDLVAIGISTAYLWMYSATSTRVSHFVRTLLYEGLGYFVVLTAINLVNLFLFRTSLGYVVVWIMSQRIILHQREAAEDYASQGMEITRELDTSREINKALRTQFETTKSGLTDLVSATMSRHRSLPMRSPGSGRGHGDEDDSASVELDVRVHVEESVEVSYTEDTLTRENYRRPKVIWDSRPRTGH
ncbi:hypothetical protein BD410DRAFT_786167 [Rickenella mellea]|uniref:DUF6533 domain-containing protein n=1 Tax=Rickenella mellea TaxID=50990 RepID=A0A4Y7QCR8_9AGAM|nr:hypothetical protein BD410DRAFT_786167 [Rickenella mellea]